MMVLALFLLAVTVGLAVLTLVKLKELSEIRRDEASVAARLDEINKNNVFLYNTVEKKLSQIREDNEKQLTLMRETVDEKLQRTLESRLSTSFKSVSDRLESVYLQLGEMQNLAKGVGNLEKVLTNVKTRGVWGELQAERILQEILTPDQYAKNIATKRSSNDVVEFAVRLPGVSEDSPVWLPIDSKFPREDYERLCDASESGNPEEIKVFRQSLEKRILREAADIFQKYIDVPNTTDFGILFLPIEGLYAEILSIAGLQDKLQRELHVLVAGPSTLASLLNSLQMGFRTLAIEKKSAQVWQVLGEVKTEFSRFSVTLEKVQEKLNSATREVEQAFVRQRAMNRKLRSVEAAEISEPEEILLEDNSNL